MNPLQEYIAIIHNRQQDPLPEGQYGERHHVIPKSCGGCNAKWNIVRLTPEEHYRCHYLLTFIYPTGKEHMAMVRACVFMNGKVRGDKVDAETYSALKKDYSEWCHQRTGERNPFHGMKHTDEWKKAASERNAGENNPQYGKPHSEEHKRKIRESSIGKKHNISEEGRKRIREAEKHWSEESRQRLRELHLGKSNITEEGRKRLSELSSKSRWFHNDEKSFFILPDDPKVKELNLIPGRLTFKRRKTA